MKETINVNIAQQAFTMDMDAYSALNAYLDDISRRLPESDTETMSDIEGRVAEIFREKVPSPMMVITYGVVRSTMAQIGAPEDFGAANRPLDSEQPRGPTPFLPLAYRPFDSRRMRRYGRILRHRLDAAARAGHTLHLLGRFDTVALPDSVARHTIRTRTGNTKLRI